MIEIDNKNSGFSKNIFQDRANIPMPISGLRYNPVNGTTGWYIWAGEYSNDDKFFEPVHTFHAYDVIPEIKKYIDMKPGTGFQIDFNGYEDVWYDESLTDEKLPFNLEKK